MSNKIESISSFPRLVIGSLAQFVGKITILFAFTLGSGIYWLSIGIFAFGIWSLLLVATFIWTVADVTASRLKSTLEHSNDYFRSVSRSLK